MASLRAQLIAQVMARLEIVRAALEWKTLVRNPRDPLGEDQFNVLVLQDGYEQPPNALTSHVEDRTLNFTVALMVIEPTDGSADFETLLDAGYVAVCDALLDPTRIQFGGLAVGIEQGAVGDPGYGRAQGSSRILAGQALDFSIRYLAREGDASASGLSGD